MAWGWRIPFLLGILIAIVGFFIRRKVPEAPTPKHKTQSPISEMVKQHKLPVLQTIGLNIMAAVCFYTVFIYMATWLVQQVHETKTIALQINTISLFVMLIATPLCAILADRIGRKPMLLIGSGLMIVLVLPLIWLMYHQSFWMILAGQAMFAVILSIFMSTMPVFMTELFPAKIRASAVSISYNIPYAIFGGTAPMVAVWLIAVTGQPTAVAWYLIAVALLAFAVALGIKETKDYQLL
jgi:MHS family proline/betaine transporter-like MFS transporter